MRGGWPRASACGALLIAVFAPGCGGGAYTKSDFIARADAICAGALRQIRSIPPPGTTQAASGPDAALAAYLSRFVPVLESEASQLRALRRPPDNAPGQAALARYLTALSQSVTNYKQLAAAAQRGDEESVANAEAALGASQVYSLATSYGLRACGSPGATTV